MNAIVFNSIETINNNSSDSLCNEPIELPISKDNNINNCSFDNSNESQKNKIEIEVFKEYSTSGSPNNGDDEYSDVDSVDTDINNVDINNDIAPSKTI